MLPQAKQPFWLEQTHRLRQSWQKQRLSGLCRPAAKPLKNRTE
jgi:hypothetical protein